MLHFYKKVMDDKKIFHVSFMRQGRLFRSRLILYTVRYERIAFLVAFFVFVSDKLTILPHEAKKARSQLTSKGERAFLDMIAVI
ncbi:hypothetical protein DZB91_18340 [Brevibacillus sp. VP]|nr:hypothetical protein [Brevibacillus laterosporus]RFB31791.1 hypothetical protein DZB91_18340 [Brevibacillus sp. VP]